MYEAVDFVEDDGRYNFDGPGLDGECVCSLRESFPCGSSGGAPVPDSLDMTPRSSRRPMRKMAMAMLTGVAAASGSNSLGWPVQPSACGLSCWPGRSWSKAALDLAASQQNAGEINKSELYTIASCSRLRGAAVTQCLTHWSPSGAGDQGLSLSCCVSGRALHNMTRQAESYIFEIPAASGDGLWKAQGCHKGQLQQRAFCDNLSREGASMPLRPVTVSARTAWARLRVGAGL